MSNKSESDDSSVEVMYVVVEDDEGGNFSVLDESEIKGDSNECKVGDKVVYTWKNSEYTGVVLFKNGE